MDTPFVNNDPQVVLSLVASGRLPESFTLLDVGASGGIARPWYAFGEKLTAFGFDRLEAEVERLNAAKPPFGKVEYVAANVVRASGEPAASAAPDTVYGKSSAARATEIIGFDWMERVNNAGAEIRYATDTISIDEFVRARGLESVDFIKTDTDGYDYSILLGAEDTLKNRGVLGVCVEVSFNTALQPEANLFANHDRYLRSLGFSLFDLDMRRYTRAALPGKFRLNVPSPTVSGQICQGDAIYLRDFADPNSEERTGRSRLTPAKLLKMIGLFEIFGLNDCAIELIQAYEDAIPRDLDVEQLCSMLAQEAHGAPDYAAYIRGFEESIRASQFGAISKSPGT